MAVDLPKFRLTRPNLFLIASLAVLVFNLFFAVKETVKMAQHRKKHPAVFLGNRFLGLEQFIGQARYIGYYTDKDLDNSIAAMQFAQAQLVLAPTLLDLNNTRHEFVIFDCTSPVTAMKKVKELRLTPLKANQFGIILSRNPDENKTQPADDRPVDTSKVLKWRRP